MKKKRVYLAAPYSHADKRVRSSRFDIVTKVAQQLMAQGVLVYSPITHGHTLAAAGELPGDFQFWSDHCLSFLRHWAEEIWVLAIPGFDSSIGVQAELEEARKLGLPVRMCAAFELPKDHPTVQ